MLRQSTLGDCSQVKPPLFKEESHKDAGPFGPRLVGFYKKHLSLFGSIYRNKEEINLMHTPT